MQPLICRFLGNHQDYTTVWQAMQTFTQQRTETDRDELWLLEHNPVYTLGRAGRPEHILHAGDIPIIQSDRGGQVTYHGPGQIVAYPLLNLKRIKISIRELVSMLEDTVIRLLALYNIRAESQAKAPGVYVKQKKIASIGLRIRRGCSYHGISLNVCNDLAPFKRINPCGYAGLEVTNMKQCTPHTSLEQVNQQLIACLAEQFGYQSVSRETLQ